MKSQIKVCLTLIAASCAFAAKKGAEPTPGTPKIVTMGQRTPSNLRAAFNQATLIRLPEGQRVMNVFGGDKGEGGLWAIDAGKVPTRFLAIKPKATGIHTTLHVVSDAGQEISFFVQEVTVLDSQFDAEVEAKEGNDADQYAREVKWVPADEMASCKQRADTIKVDVAAVQRKAEEEAAAKLAQYQAEYPKKALFWV